MTVLFDPKQVNHIPNNKNRILAISDIHGEHQSFIDLLNVTCYEPEEDQLILLGDYVDRGKDSKKVLQEVMMLQEQGAIALRGNHEQMFLDWLDNKDHNNIFIYNGGVETIESILGEPYVDGWHSAERAKRKINTEHKDIIDFIRGLSLFYETDTHIFVHAGIDPNAIDWTRSPKSVYIWSRDEFIFSAHNTGKIIVFGHTPTSRIRKQDKNHKERFGSWDEASNVWDGGDKIGIDGGCCFGNQLNCLSITHDEHRSFNVKKWS